MGRKAASSLAVHEYLQAHPLTKIGTAAKDLKLSIPTVTSALETLTKLRIAKESTGKRRDRLFVYPRYLHILSEGTEPLNLRGSCFSSLLWATELLLPSVRVPSSLRG
jgi:hypothetical protein